MALQLLNRYRYKGTDTLFAPWPYLQFRWQRVPLEQHARGAICLVWLFWSLRLTWTNRL